MGIEATTSSISAASTQSVSSSSTVSKSSDTSFKEEMSKVEESDSKAETKASEKESKNVKDDKKTSKTEVSNKKTDKTDNVKNNIGKNKEKIEDINNSALLNAQLSMNDANKMLSNDIAQMLENTTAVSTINSKNWSIGFDDGVKSNIKMNESDADFFINLAQNEDININVINSQAQSLLNHGAETAEVKQNVQVSQALLNALSEAREKNQPLRIDFDQNVSVILRIGRDGAISAHFIPGDKAVEQYLRNNLESLKSTFDEQELPYSELSYSHSSKEQNQRRRDEKRQGE